MRGGRLVSAGVLLLGPAPAAGGATADALSRQRPPASYGLRDARSVAGSPQLVAVATGHLAFACGPAQEVTVLAPSSPWSRLRFPGGLPAGQRGVALTPPPPPGTRP